MLPIASDSVDLVILMHHLSNTSEPHAVLREAFRILIPEGKLIIIDFNPMSLWGLRHFFQSWLERVPFKGHYFTARRIDDWMRLLGFDQYRHYRIGYLPPLQKASITRHLTLAGKRHQELVADFWSTQSAGIQQEYFTPDSGATSLGSAQDFAWQDCPSQRRTRYEV